MDKFHTGKGFGSCHNCFCTDNPVHVLWLWIICSATHILFFVMSVTTNRMNDITIPESVLPVLPLFNYVLCVCWRFGQEGHLLWISPLSFLVALVFYCVKLGYSRRHQSERFTLTNPPSVLARASANIRRNPPSAFPEDIGPRMKGLTDERKYIFALSIEFCQQGAISLTTEVVMSW